MSMSAREVENSILAAGLHTEFMEFRSGEVEILVKDDDGDVDYEATEELTNQVIDAMEWAAYRTGYGAWVVSETHKVSHHDYCSTSWEGHY